MSSNLNAKTGVFWDVEDYPILNFSDPLLVKNKIKEVVRAAGYTGELSILLWVDKKYESDDLLQMYSAAEIPITFLPEDKVVENMMVGIVLWAFENYPVPANVMVVSKYVGLGMDEYLRTLHRRDYRIFLSDPAPKEFSSFPPERLDWLLPNLTSPYLNTMKRKIADSSDPVRQLCSTSAHSNWSDFPSALRDCDTVVMWDVKDISILGMIDSDLTSDKIILALEDKGYGCRIIYALLDCASVDSSTLERYEITNIVLQESDEAAARSTFLAMYALFLAMTDFAYPTCFLILSEDPSFKTVVDALNKKDFPAGLVMPSVFLCPKKAQDQKSASSQA